MRTSEVLRLALDLLEGQGTGTPAWTRDAMARNKYRHEVSPNGSSAVKFCALGAICNVLNENSNDIPWNPSEDYRDAEKALMDALPAEGRLDWYRSIDYFNDDEETTFDDVRSMYQRAIKYAEEWED